jgi:hypothetical protein
MPSTQMAEEVQKKHRMGSKKKGLDLFPISAALMSASSCLPRKDPDFEVLGQTRSRQCWLRPS